MDSSLTLYPDSPRLGSGCGVPLSGGRPNGSRITHPLVGRLYATYPMVLAEKA